MPGTTSIVILASSSIAGAALFFTAGCGQRQREIDLYVDAVMLRELGKNEQAIEMLNEAVRSKREFPEAYSLLGETYYDIKAYDKSAASYERAVELNPWSFKDHFTLGKIYQTMKKLPQAAKAYSRACELDPDHLEAHISTAKCCFQLKDFDKALSYAQRAEQINPNASEVQLVLADIYESRTDYDQAIESYKRALARDRNNPQIMICLAGAYVKTERYGNAKELLTLLARIQPGDGTAYRYLGYCHLKLDEVDQAVQSYSKAVEIDDRDWQAHKGLGVAYMLKARHGQDERLRLRAVEHWRVSLNIEPNQPGREMLLELIRKHTK